MSNAVLCAVDISNAGEDASVLKVAAEMAEQSGAQLDVITVIPDFGTSLVGSFFNEKHHDEVMVQAKEKLNAEVINVIGKDKNANVRHLVSFGKAYEEVLKAAKEAKSSLIVVGAHKPDLKDYLLGPNAARIVRHSNCSVYVVR